MDLALNLRSFMEMRSATVAAYIAELERVVGVGGLLYLVNRYEKDTSRVTWSGSRTTRLMTDGGRSLSRHPSFSPSMCSARTANRLGNGGRFYLRGPLWQNKPAVSQAPDPPDHIVRRNGSESRMPFDMPRRDLVRVRHRQTDIVVATAYETHLAEGATPLCELVALGPSCAASAGGNLRRPCVRAVGNTEGHAMSLIKGTNSHMDAAEADAHFAARGVDGWAVASQIARDAALMEATAYRTERSVSWAAYRMSSSRLPGLELMRWIGKGDATTVSSPTRLRARARSWRSSRCPAPGTAA